MVTVKSTKKRLNYACAADYNHYGIWLNEEEIYVEEEYVDITINDHLYMIIQYHNQFLNKHQTNIITFTINGDGNVVDKLNQQFTFPKSLFDFSRTNLEKLKNRLKTILVFQ